MTIQELKLKCYELTPNIYCKLSEAKQVFEWITEDIKQDNKRFNSPDENLKESIEEFFNKLGIPTVTFTEKH